MGVAASIGRSGSKMKDEHMNIPFNLWIVWPGSLLTRGAEATGNGPQVIRQCSPFSSLQHGLVCSLRKQWVSGQHTEKTTTHSQAYRTMRPFTYLVFRSISCRREIQPAGLQSRKNFGDVASSWLLNGEIGTRFVLDGRSSGTWVHEPLDERRGSESMKKKNQNNRT